MVVFFCRTIFFAGFQLTGSGSRKYSLGAGAEEGAEAAAEAVVERAYAAVAIVRLTNIDLLLPPCTQQDCAQLLCAHERHATPHCAGKQILCCTVLAQAVCKQMQQKTQ